MAKKNSRDNLGYLGVDFQYKLIKSFMDDHKFFRDLNNIIDQNMFTDPNLKTYVGVLKEYFETYDVVPSYSMMNIELRSKASGELQVQFYEDTIKKLMETSSEGAESIRDKALKFFKQQNIIKTANEILKIAGDGDISKYDRCVDLLQEALNKGTDEDMGTSIFDNIEEVLSDDYRCPIPTGIGKVDEVLEGGLGKGELGVIIGPTSFGKALHINELVVTPNGYRTIGSIKVGDYVIGRNGKQTKVLGVFPQGKRDLYRVTFSDGVSCLCDKEHLWAVNSNFQRNGKKYIKGKSAQANNYKKFKNQDFSYKVMTLSEIMNHKLILSGGRHNFKIPMCEAVHFNEIKTSISPYLMGYMIGDGNFNRCDITVGVQDYESVIGNFNESFKSHYIEKRNIYSLSFKVKDELKKYYDLSLTSGDKYIHNDFLFNSLNNRIELLNGLMDSDGTCQKNGCSCFNTKSKQLALDVKQLVLSLGGFAKVREKHTGYYSKKYERYVDCGIQYEVTISLCDSNIPIFKLKRKQDRVVYRSLRKGERFIHSIEYECNDDAVCIKVDADDELFLTRDFIVTHNTSMTTAMASYAATYKCEQNNFSGYKVLQIVFEDREKQIQRKHLARISGIEAKDLSKEDFREQVKKYLTEFEDRDLLKNNLLIKRFPSGEVSASKLKRYIQKLINAGFKPDMVIVDYFECVEPEQLLYGENEWNKEGKTMRKLESMAGELDIALWVPTQGTKDSINLELVTMDKAGGSAKKVQIGHIIMSIARTMEDMDKNLATIAILKNRAGKSGKVFNGVEFNNGTCRISTDHVDEFDSMMDYNKNKEQQNLDLAREIFKKVQGEK